MENKKITVISYYEENRDVGDVFNHVFKGNEYSLEDVMKPEKMMRFGRDDCAILSNVVDMIENFKVEFLKEINIFPNNEYLYSLIEAKIQLDKILNDHEYDIVTTKDMRSLNSILDTNLIKKTLISNAKYKIQIENVIEIINHSIRFRLIEDIAVFYVLDIQWHGHEPQSEFIPEYAIKRNFSENDLSILLKRIIKNKKYFGTCHECGLLQNSSNLIEKTCTSCMEKNHHIVF